MKRKLLILGYVVFAFLLVFGQIWGQCPEDTVDSGICDTLYVEIFPEDQWPVVFPHIARFPIYITHDVPDPNTDSLIAIVIPLCYTHTNSATYCSLNSFWNTTLLPYYPNWEEHSVFRDLEISPGDTLFNWMANLARSGQTWSNIIFDLGDQVSHFWLSCIPTAQTLFGEGSRVLWATMTFKMGDTTTICIDSCFWPPNSRLIFARGDGRCYAPQHFMPVCEHIWFPCPLQPLFYFEFDDQFHNANGHYTTDRFEVWCGCYPDYMLESVWVTFSGEGVENVEIIPLSPIHYDFMGYVSYDVTDHCQSGGEVTIHAMDNSGTMGSDFFNIELQNNAPILNLPDTWNAVTDHNMGLWVSASDEDGDSISDIVLDALWYEPDSLQPPTNPPSFDGGNPGLFTWEPTEADDGIWICSFSVSDACETVRHEVSIQVGTPFCGDCAENVEIDVNDVVYLINWLYKGGTAPEPFCKGDANCDEDVDVSDVVYLINYLFKYGSAPCFECCGKKL
jgi:hypothetical protein